MWGVHAWTRLLRGFFKLNQTLPHPRIACPRRAPALLPEAQDRRAPHLPALAPAVDRGPKGGVERPPVAVERVRVRVARGEEAQRAEHHGGGVLQRAGDVGVRGAGRGGARVRGGREREGAPGARGGLEEGDAAGEEGDVGLGAVRGGVGGGKGVGPGVGEYVEGDAFGDGVHFGVDGGWGRGERVDMGDGLE